MERKRRAGKILLFFFVISFIFIVENDKGAKKWKINLLCVDILFTMIQRRKDLTFW